MTGEDAVVTLAAVTRVGFALATGDVARLTDYYVSVLGFHREAMFDNPPYAILERNGIRLSLAEAGHAAADLPGFVMTAHPDRGQPSSMLILEVPDCDAARAELESRGAVIVSATIRPPWGGARFFITDPDRNVIEVEQPA